MLTIVTISYNSGEVLQKCLAPLIDSGAYPVIIIDNASTDGSAAALKERFPHAQVVLQTKNTGYGRAANVGLGMADTPYALLLNPDLTASADDIARLLNHATNDSSNTAIWGPASVCEDRADHPPEEVQWISGCAMLFDMEKMKKIGFFDENIFLFFEETDLCTRAAESGFRIKQCNDVCFPHLLGQASRPSPAIEYLKNWHFGWSRCYYFDKHRSSIRKRQPKQQYAQYRRKSLFALNRKKQMKYQAQAAGAKAFLLGEKAFLPDGTPQKEPVPSQAGGRGFSGSTN
jgi:GT2 family glycosyltransferase